MSHDLRGPLAQDQHQQGWANRHGPNSRPISPACRPQAVLTPPGSVPWSPSPRVDHSLLKAVVRAHRWREILENGEYASATELAKAEKVNDSYVSRILRLTLLAPESTARGRAKSMIGAGLFRRRAN